MKSCIIFGGNGFLGSHLAANLVSKDVAVKVFDIDSKPSSFLMPLINKINYIPGDFLNTSDYEPHLEGVDSVFHYISTTSPKTSSKNPIYDIETNLMGSIQLLKSCVKKKVIKVIYPSSGGTIYGLNPALPSSEQSPADPPNPYAITKFAVENYLKLFYHDYGLDYLVLRYSNPYGEGQNLLKEQGVVASFLEKLYQQQLPVILGDGTSVRDYIYIDDAIEATVRLSLKNTRDKIFNIGSGTGVSLNELYATILTVTGKKITPQYIKSKAHVYVPKIFLDISRVTHELDWKPGVSLAQGLRKTWNWIQSTR